MRHVKSRDRVILYGAGLAGEKFYHAHGDQIDYVIDNRRKENFHGLHVHPLKDRAEDVCGRFVVIAADREDVYKSIEDSLIDLGLIEFDDYIRAEAYGRKLALIYGNCHMESFQKIIDAQPWFSRRFYSRRVYVAASNPSERSPKESLLRNADIVISQDIRNDNGFGAMGIDTVRSMVWTKCSVVVIPNVFGCNIYFPQATKPDIKVVRAHAGENADPLQQDFIRQITGWEDPNIEKWSLNGLDAVEIAGRIRTDQVYGGEWIKQFFSKAITKLEEREKGCNIIISDYIKRNYRARKLFFDPRHPCNVLVSEKVKRVVEYLGGIFDDTASGDSPESWMDGDELFIYGCVKQTLGLEFDDDYIKIGAKHSTLFYHPITLEEYVDTYIKWHRDDGSRI